MNTPLQPTPGSPSGLDPDAGRVAPPLQHPARPLYWSVRREIWENRSLYIAPLIAAVLGFVAFCVSLVYLLGPSGTHTMRKLLAMDAMGQKVELAMPYAHAEMLLTLTAFLVGIFYCLDALHGERRDRSILFWKSMPVSDLTTVLSKAAIPFAFLPLLTLGIAAVLESLMLVVSGFTFALTHSGAAMWWSTLPLFEMVLGFVYSVIVIVLWHAPIYCWMLLVSGYARRAPFLWAFLPPAALAAFEFLAFRTYHIGLILRDRFFGFAPDAFNLKLPDGSTVDGHYIPLSQFTPGRFLGSPGLWIGLLLAAAFFAAAVRMRRYREPL